MFLRRQKLSLKQQIHRWFIKNKGHTRPFAYLIWRLKRLPGTPEFIARGFAIGVAVNFWPILFTHVVIGYIFCKIFRGSVISMFTGTLLGNPWTFAMVFPLMYKIGKVLLGLKPVHAEQSLDSAEEVMSQIWPIESWHSLTLAFQEIIIPMMIGGFLLGLPVTIASYYLARNGVEVYQTQRRRHLLKKFESVEHEIETVHEDNA